MRKRVVDNSNAIKLNFKKDSHTKDGDGDDNEITLIEKIEISTAINGWIVTSTYENGDEFVEVFNTDGKDNGNRRTIECVIESMGIGQEIKLKE